MKVINAELIIALDEFKAEMETLGERPQMSDYLGEVFMNIAEQAAYKSNYSHEASDADMVADAYLKCVEKVASFNSEKSNNPHAYFTQICRNSFHDTMSKNNEYDAMKCEYMQELDVATTGSEAYLASYKEHNPDKRKGTEHNWIRTDGHTFTGTIVNLVKEFPSAKLNQSALSKVVRGLAAFHRDWKINK